jgi:TetR/AcrR family transcriptional regulator, repressor for uid operon
MPKLKPDASEARRNAILDAAESCFKTRGFHQTSIKDICTAGSFSPGALYIYFPSKEALIEGLITRQMLQAREMLEGLPDQPDMIGTIVDLPGAWASEARADGNVAMNADILSEALRNPRIAHILEEDSAELEVIYENAVQAAQRRGEFSAELKSDAVSSLLIALSDGLMMRHLINPQFDSAPIQGLLRKLLAPGAAPAEETHK